MIDHATDIQIRPISPDDSLEELTDLLHRAYASLANLGMRFFASYQTVDDTRDRIAGGHCLIASRDGRMIGTITWYRTFDHERPLWYRRDDVAFFGQFAVEPELQGLGIGNRLLHLAEEAAAEMGFREMALDTSERAIHLIDYYARHGYRFVEHVQWRSTNYRSVVMSKPIAEDGRLGRSERRSS
jgi:GNAT superfamily N-acetyltransferase